jgi:hypothetical protein
LKRSKPNALFDQKQLGFALGAFGEFSESANLLIVSLAHKGALNNPDKCGQSNYQAALRQIHWRLQRRGLLFAIFFREKRNFFGSAKCNEKLMTLLGVGETSGSHPQLFFVRNGIFGKFEQNFQQIIVLALNLSKNGRKMKKTV